MAAMDEAYDLTCVIHLHSTYSDGTGTVPQIARAAEKAGVDVVFLTDHDTLAAKDNGEEGWYGNALVLVGEEVSPTDRDHYLAFGIDRNGLFGGIAYGSPRNGSMRHSFPGNVARFCPFRYGSPCPPASPSAAYR